jgi:hypothetical protein
LGKMQCERLVCTRILPEREKEDPLGEKAVPVVCS